MKGTITFELEYDPDVEQHKASYGELGLVGYADINYAGNTESR